MGGSPFFVVTAFPFTRGQGGQLLTCAAMLGLVLGMLVLAHDAATRVPAGWALHLAQAARAVLAVDLLVVLFFITLVIDNRPVYLAG